MRTLGIAENSERGVWWLTPVGVSVSDAEILAVPQKVRAAQHQKKRHQDENESQHGDSEKLGTEGESDDDEATELSWKEKLLDALLGMSPAGFERLCRRILRESGFVKVDL